MKRFRIRQWGGSDWTYVEIRGDMAAGIGSIIETSFWSWSGRLHVQEEIDNSWEDLDL
jgi:hypothetical protein